MKMKNLISILLLVFVVSSGVLIIIGRDFGGERGKEGSRVGEEEYGEGELDPSSPGEGHRVVAWYFHTTKRCPTCVKIETYTRESIEGNFADLLESGFLELRVINVEEPENEHFIEDYGLTTKSVIISDFIDGEQVAWKNLDKVWEYTGDRRVFVDYIRDETALYLAELLEK
ncbi:MAG: hypothetical protein JXB45_06625 [Candidatus Krumholzibacteriota bacterium]|nr:hypothetical protein [Candidatus Krumholzibacteriota bacterium]